MYWFAEIAVILAVIGGIHAWRTHDAASGLAPMLDADTIDGESISLTAGRLPALVHFWATWCTICRIEQDTINALAADHQVVTVALSSGSDEEILDYLKEHGLRFPVINDDAGDISAKWGVVGVPTTFVVDTAGSIRFVTSGYTTGPGLRARLWLAGRQ